MTPTEKIREVLDRTVADAEQALADAKRTGVDDHVRRMEDAAKVARSARAQAEEVLSALAERGIDADPVLSSTMELVTKLPIGDPLASAWSLLSAAQRMFCAAKAVYDAEARDASEEP